ncbi:MAG TPA: hypothetical protein VKA84_12945 [Gemmatimonadaceae bacterium]|nr:hypothetical protein [Gemmatimonadaceae bacterium]
MAPIPSSPDAAGAVLRPLAIAVLWAALCACRTQASGGARQQQKPETPMSDAFVSVWDKQPVPAEEPARPITPAGPPAAGWARAVPERTVAARAFLTEERNSRLAGALPAGGAWRVRWTHDVSQGVLPAWVLTAGTRIVVQGEGMWELLDTDGGRIRTGVFAAEAIALDPERALFYAVGTGSEIVARNLADGEKAFYFALTFGKKYARQYLARPDGRFIALSVEQVIDPHAPGAPNTSMVETVTLPERPVVDSMSGHASAPVSGHLFHQSVVLAGAVRGGAVAVATENRLTYADIQLKIRRHFSGEFVPVSLSLDEGGRAYMLVNAGGRRALWVVTPAGERAAAAELPDEAREAAHPPIVGYDHTVYVLGADRVYAYAPDGSPRWQSAPGARPAGAAVTADDRLLASVGSRLVAFAPGGEPAVLHEFPGEQLRTAPVMTAAGEILVASRGKLYCLTRE